MQKTYTLSTDQVLKNLGVDTNGLNSQQVQERLDKYGPNKLKEGEKPTLLQRFLAQLKDPMLIILMIAAAVSALSGMLAGESEWAEVIIILAVVLLNAILGVIQESKAEAAIEALQTMTAATCKVLRDGKMVVLHSDELVPGDVVLLEAGDAVPADGRIIENASLKIEEAALTGESVPVNKMLEALGMAGGQDEVPLGDRKNMCYMGSTVVYGRGKAVITGTGMDTEMGKIAGALAATEEEETPLQRKLDELGKLLSKMVLGICVFIFAFNPIMEGDFHLEVILETFMVAVSLAVAAIPEGLATVVTVVLSIGVTRMSQRNAVIRRLTAVETLGCTQVICSDKTGTLTQNKMTVVDHIGETKLVATAMALCSDANLNDENQAEGEPTECALVNFAADHSAAGGSLPGQCLQLRDDLLDRVRHRHRAGPPGHPRCGNRQVYPARINRTAFLSAIPARQLRLTGFSVFSPFTESPESSMIRSGIQQNSLNCGGKNMKKQIAFSLALVLLVGLLAGCAGTPVVYYSNCTCPTGSHAATPSEPALTEGAVKTGLAIVTSIGKSVSATAEAEGKAEYDVTLVAVTVDDNGIITDCIIDSLGTSVAFGSDGVITTDLTAAVSTKNELGDAYGMSQVSQVGEWYQQADALAQYAVGKTVEELRAGAVSESGYAADADLAASATIYLGGYVSAVETAVANAKHLGAQAGDELKLASISSLGDSRSADAENAGNAQLNCDAVALTMNGGTITSCLIDSVQAKVAFDAAGVITSDLSAPAQTKNELGENYGMKAWGGATYEWNEQAANFSAYVTGKTPAEVAGIAVNESTKPTDADLASSVTIAIGGFQALIAKAAQ